MSASVHWEKTDADDLFNPIDTVLFLIKKGT